jgi:hypothetical protein
VDPPRRAHAGSLIPAAVGELALAPMGEVGPAGYGGPEGGGGGSHSAQAILELLRSALRRRLFASQVAGDSK